MLWAGWATGRSIRRRVRLAAVVLGVVGALGATSCSLNRGDSVAAVGDSITSLDEPAMRAELGDDYDLFVSGSFGKTVAQVMAQAAVIAPTGYDQVIINLGTNDVIQGIPTESSMSSMSETIALFDSAECIHLVDLNENMVDAATDRSVSAEATNFNAALRELAATDSRISIIEWSVPTSETLNDAAPPWSTLTTDSIHPTDEGNEVLNDLYDDALSSCGSPFGGL